MNLSNIVTTPTGGSASAAGIISLIFNVLLPPVWPWFAHQSTTWRGGVVTVILFVGTYLGGWLKVVMAKGQKITTELTSSNLPTVQVETTPEPAKLAA
jgi:hypothetical protein